MPARPAHPQPSGAAPTVLCINHLDACAGTGLQTDIQALSAMGLRVACAVTAVYAVQRGGTRLVHTVPPRAIQAQIDAAWRLMRPSACRIGALPTPAAANAVRERLKRRELPNVVFAPHLPEDADGPALSSKRRRAILGIVPECELLVLSATGARVLLGGEGDLAGMLHEAGARWALVTGVCGPNGVRDLLIGPGEQVTMPHRNPPSREAERHTVQLVASIAAGRLALGSDVVSAAKRARTDAARIAERMRARTSA